MSSVKRKRFTGCNIKHFASAVKACGDSFIVVVYEIENIKSVKFALGVCNHRGGANARIFNLIGGCHNSACRSELLKQLFGALEQQLVRRNYYSRVALRSDNESITLNSAVTFKDYFITEVEQNMLLL